MATETKTKEEFKEKMERLQPMWQSFQAFRVVEWPSLYRLRRPVQTDSSIEQYADGIDIESPILAYDRGQHMKIKRLNPTKIDVTPMATGKDAEKASERQRIYFASLWNTVNAGGKISAPWAQNTTDSGVFFGRVHWRFPSEPKEDDVTKRVDKMRGEEEDDDTYETKKSERSITARDEYFNEQTQAYWWIEPIQPGSLTLNNCDDPTELFLVQEIDFSAARELERDKKLGGGHFDIENSKIGWAGQKRVPGERGGENNLTSNETIEYIRWEYQEPGDKDRWHYCEYVCFKGKYEDAEKFNEDVIPFGESSFLIVPSGDEVPMETDPHLRYMPTQWAQLQLTSLINYLTTTIAIIGRRETVEDIYLDISQLTQDTRQYLEDNGASQELIGGKQMLVFRRPEPGSSEVAMYPGKLNEFPKKVSEHLMIVLQMAKEELATVRPNRLMVGDFVAAKEPETAAMGLNQMQAAAMNWGGDLVNHDERLVKAFFEKVRKCILFWDKEVPSENQKRYPVITSGDEPVMSGQVTPGKQYTLSAEDFKVPTTIKVLTKNETQAERAMNTAMSREAFRAGEKRWVKHLKDIGYDAPEDEARALEIERIERQRQPRADQVRQMAVETYVSLTSRVNLMMLAGGPPMPEGYDQQQQSQQSSGGSGLTVGPSVTPPPVQGVTGGNMSSMGSGL